MSIFLSLASQKFRKTFLAFFALTAILPLLVLILLLYQYIFPLLTSIQMDQIRDPLTYGLLAMFFVPLLGFFLMSWWTRTLETLTQEVKNKTSQVVDIHSEPAGQNEMKALEHMFEGLYQELQSKIGQLNEYSKKLIDVNAKLAQLAVTDELTTLYNKRYFQTRLVEEVDRAERYKQKLTLIMIDVDGFKNYNDTCGHQAGDKLLRQLGLLFRKITRKSDIPCRYGGDEFALILPECTTQRAEAIARKLVASVERFSGQGVIGDKKANISISCGVAGYEGQIEKFVAAADRRLYQAKSSGKGRVIGPSESSRPA